MAVVEAHLAVPAGGNSPTTSPSKAMSLQISKASYSAAWRRLADSLPERASRSTS